jgi:hypothetical protein
VRIIIVIENAGGKPDGRLVDSGTPGRDGDGAEANRKLATISAFMGSNENSTEKFRI